MRRARSVAPERSAGGRHTCHRGLHWLCIASPQLVGSLRVGERSQGVNPWDAAAAILVGCPVSACMTRRTPLSPPAGTKDAAAGDLLSIAQHVP